MTGAVSEQFELLCRRDWLLDLLSEGAAERAELRSAGDVSRSTIDRSVAELVAAGLVEETDGAVRLTLHGRLVHEQFRASRNRLAGIDRAAGLLNALPRGAELPSALLETGSVHEEAAARARHEAVVKAAERVRGSLLALAMTDVRVYYEQALHGTDFRVVLASALTEQLLSGASEEFAEGLEQGGVAVRETDDPLPYSLLVADIEGETHACVCVQAADGVVEGFIESTHPDAVAWAEARFDSAWAEATELG